MRTDTSHDGHSLLASACTQNGPRKRPPVAHLEDLGSASDWMSDWKWGQSSIQRPIRRLQPCRGLLWPAAETGACVSVALGSTGDLSMRLQRAHDRSRRSTKGLGRGLLCCQCQRSAATAMPLPAASTTRCAGAAFHDRPGD